MKNVNRVSRLFMVEKLDTFAIQFLFFSISTWCIVYYHVESIWSGSDLKNMHTSWLLLDTWWFLKLGHYQLIEKINFFHYVCIMQVGRIIDREKIQIKITLNKEALFDINQCFVQNLMILYWFIKYFFENIL